MKYNFKTTFVWILSTTVPNGIYCVATSFQELQFALSSYPDKKQSGSNGLEHVGMETSYMHIQDKLYKFCFKYYDAKATKPPCEVKESFPKIIKVAITPGQLKIYT